MDIRQRRPLPGTQDEDEKDVSKRKTIIPEDKILKVVPLVAIGLSTRDPLWIKTARAEIVKLLRAKHCHPILSVAEGWPRAGGATGSIRFHAEMSHGANAGLDIALALLAPIKRKARGWVVVCGWWWVGVVVVPGLSWADLIQLASVVAIREAGGPFIPLFFGRLDAPTPEEGAAPDGRLPTAGAPFPDGAPSAAQHVRNVFGRMGLSDRDIVALSGAHTLGRARPERSGWGRDSTPHTVRGPGTPGGQSWTPEWLKFDNSYFRDHAPLASPPDMPPPHPPHPFQKGFRPWAEKYAADQRAFFADYVAAHLRLSELGVKWVQEDMLMLWEE
eukprot:scaffold22.g6075.t1